MNWSSIEATLNGDYHEASFRIGVILECDEYRRVDVLKPDERTTEILVLKRENFTDRSSFYDLTPMTRFL
jgi:hypothetical protein